MGGNSAQHKNVLVTSFVTIISFALFAFRNAIFYKKKICTFYAQCNTIDNTILYNGDAYNESTAIDVTCKHLNEEDEEAAVTSDEHMISDK